MPSSSLRISLVYRARDCRCTVLVAGTRSLAVVGTRPGARNWLASAFSEEEACGQVRRCVTGGTGPGDPDGGHESSVLSHQLLCLQHPLEEIHLAGVFVDHLRGRFAVRQQGGRNTCPLSPARGQVPPRNGARVSPQDLCTHLAWVFSACSMSSRAPTYWGGKVVSASSLGSAGRGQCGRGGGAGMEGQVGGAKGRGQRQGGGGAAARTRGVVRTKAGQAGGARMEAGPRRGWDRC